MHILVTNDDGPPSRLSSPYVLPFVQALQRAGHVVSVIVPAEQRSWIGKAHLIGRDVVASAYWPPATTPEEHDVERRAAPEGDGDGQPWVLVDSTPASCAQLGLSESFFRERGKVDLGRNTTAVFALSSGTLGAALEAAICGHRAIALSFAFFDRTNDPAVVAEASAHAVRVCLWLAAQPDGQRAWDGGAVLYSVNVPLQTGVSGRRVVWTRMLQNQWRKGACFQEIPPAEAAGEVEGEPERQEREVREREVGKAGGAGSDSASAAAGMDGHQKSPSRGEWRTRHFRWAPRFTDVYDSVQAAGPGSDGWAVKEGETSITALRANFMHVDGLEGEVKL